MFRWHLEALLHSAGDRRRELATRLLLCAPVYKHGWPAEGTQIHKRREGGGGGGGRR